MDISFEYFSFSDFNRKSKSFLCNIQSVHLGNEGNLLKLEEAVLCDS